MNLNDYQHEAQRTDQNPTEDNRFVEPTKARLIPLLGMAGEVGTLLSEYKKLIRDGAVHLRFREQLREELGDILWYVANVATKFGLDLEEIATANLRKTHERWLRTQQLTILPDEEFPEGEQLPRDFEFLLGYDVGGESHRVMVRDVRTGKQVGDLLTDNSYIDDGYRFHDVLHFAHAAILGWSPVLRKLLGRKRKSRPRVDEVQDGGRALVLDEAVVAIEFEYARRHNMFNGASQVDWELIRAIKRLTEGLEVSNATAGDWERAILVGFNVWRQVRENDGGIVLGNLRQKTFEYKGPLRTPDA